MCVRTRVCVHLVFFKRYKCLSAAQINAHSYQFIVIFSLKEKKQFLYSLKLSIFVWNAHTVPRTRLHTHACMYTIYNVCLDVFVYYFIKIYYVLFLSIILDILTNHISNHINQFRIKNVKLLHYDTHTHTQHRHKLKSKLNHT